MTKKKKEAEIHTVEYRFMPHNLYELQMNEPDMYTKEQFKKKLNK